MDSYLSDNYVDDIDDNEDYYVDDTDDIDDIANDDINTNIGPYEFINISDLRKTLKINASISDEEILQNVTLLFNITFINEMTTDNLLRLLDDKKELLPYLGVMVGEPYTDIYPIRFLEFYAKNCNVCLEVLNYLVDIGFKFNKGTTMMCTPFYLYLQHNDVSLDICKVFWSYEVAKVKHSKNMIFALTIGYLGEFVKNIRVNDIEKFNAIIDYFLGIIKDNTTNDNSVVDGNDDDNYPLGSYVENIFTNMAKRCKTIATTTIKKLLPLCKPVRVNPFSIFFHYDPFTKTEFLEIDGNKLYDIIVTLVEYNLANGLSLDDHFMKTIISKKDNHEQIKTYLLDNGFKFKVNPFEKFVFR